MMNAQTATDEDVLELQTTLREDVQGDAAREILAVVRQSLHVVQARLRQPLPQADFRAAEQLALALEAAESVVRQVWATMHGRPLAA
jgi:hypothetical protein